LYDVITVGSGTVDAFVNTGSKLFGKPTIRSHIKVPFGSKIAVDSIEFHIGGGGTNTAVSFSRLGLKVAFIGSLGNCENANRILELLKKEKISTELVQMNKGESGYSVILDAKGRDRTILTYKGNNDFLNFNKINKKKLKTKWFYFSSMLGESFLSLEKLAEYAIKHEIKLAYNPSSYIAKKGLKFNKYILNKTNILILNKEEAGYLAGTSKIKKMLKRLLKAGPQIVAITDGKKMIYAAEGNNMYYVVPEDIKVTETTGAGDAFASTFLAGIIKKGDIEFAMKLGVANSLSVITHHGAKNKLLNYNEALNKSMKIKIKKENF
jgi:ribokinase